MTCYHPLDAHLRVSGSTSRYFVAFKPPGRPVLLPCGKCIGCRIDKTSEWATRLCNEAQMHKHNTFITLTYGDEHLPHDMSISVRELQLFFKKFRKRIYPQKIRFYACGEYGEKLHRPHYHALIFGYEFPDAKFFKESRGNIYKTSKLLSKMWGKGHCIIGDVTHQSAAYCARYVTKKINGEPWHNHYQAVNRETGELTGIRPEFAIMSRKPGIGNEFYNRYKSDLFPDDFIVVEGKKRRMPAYYMSLLRQDNPELYQEMKLQRLKRMETAAERPTPDLESKEINAIRRADKLLRSLE